MPFFESHNRYAHRILGRFDGYCAGIEKKNSAGGGLHNILLILSHTEHIDYREFLTIRLNQLLAVRFSLIGGEVYFGKLAVFKEEQHKALIVCCNRHIHGVFIGLHLKL